MMVSCNPIAFVALLVSSASGFGVSPSLHTATKANLFSRSVQVHAIRCEDKYYQLEEMEDSESCTTELFLMSDGSVSFGATDGPQWAEAVGRWEVQPGTNDFKMDIVRKYASGQGSTDMGEFDYAVDRTFIGEMTSVGDSVGITGSMVHFPNGVPGPDQQEVGFFNMIDATDVREDRRPEARVGVQEGSNPNPPIW